jgi:hypothetical protein
MSDCGITRDMFLVMGQRSPANINHLDSDGNFLLFRKENEIYVGRSGRLVSTINPANPTS